MINWKLRLMNKTTLVALAVAVIAFVYQVLGILGVVAPIAQDSVTQIVMLLINALYALGIVVDPTTKGIGDSTRALGYEEPKKDEE